MIPNRMFQVFSRIDRFAGSHAKTKALNEKIYHDRNLRQRLGGISEIRCKLLLEGQNQKNLKHPTNE